ncbi:MAG: ImmA/IrrE family metallo-endopeptidase [Neoaquamicrobium sediminum]
MDLAEVAEHYAYLPDVRITRPFAVGGHRALRDEDIEDIAGQVRSDWGVGLKPIVDLLPQMERSGIVIAAETMETVKLDGLSAWDERSGRPFVLLANDKQSYARRQFDAAHELGHIVLHRGLSEEDLVSDFDMIEDQAHKFASALLLPAVQYCLELTDLSLWGLERLKSRWRVSIKAQIMRLRQLNILDREAATKLFKGYSARGYARGEPYDDVWKLQQPSLLADTFNAITGEGGISRQELLANLPFKAHDAESLAVLPSGWFSRSTGHVVQLRDFRPREPGHGRP